MATDKQHEDKVTADLAGRLFDDLTAPRLIASKIPASMVAEMRKQHIRDVLVSRAAENETRARYGVAARRD